MKGGPVFSGEGGFRMRRALPWLALVLLALAGPACSRLSYRPPPGPRGGVEVGLASWYGREFHGRPTSNREIYNMNDMTAAHPTLPFGTTLMVTNLDNQRTAVVRVNDRGPFVGGRIIDVSYAAARVLGMIGPGTARIRLEVLEGYAAAAPAARFSVQVGAFAVQENAYVLRRQLEARYEGVFVTTFKTPNRTYFRVRIRAKDRDEALQTARRLADDGFPVILMEE
jgi:rare lipoprotein A